MRLRNPALAATFAIIGTLSACGDPPETRPDPPAGAASATAACFLRAAHSPCQLLTLKRAQKLFPAARAADINEFVSQYSSSCTISWAGGRKLSVKDSLTLSQIRKVNRDAFIRQHRNDISDKERAPAFGQSQVPLRRNAEDGAQDTQPAGQDFAQMPTSQVQWEAIRGLGDRAAWGGVGRHKTLNVLVDNAMFTIRADISDEESEQLAASKQLAQALIDACN